MPFASKAQAGLFHSPDSPVDKKTVAEFDKASRGKHLPEHVQKLSGGGYACMHCGGEVDEDGISGSMEPEGDEHDWTDGDQHEDIEELRHNAFADAFGRRR